jgi:hypothetical protein
VRSSSAGQASMPGSSFNLAAMRAEAGTISGSRMNRIRSSLRLRMRGSACGYKEIAC